MISESETLGVREFKGEAKDMATKKKLSATGTRVLAVKLTEEEKRLRGDELAQAEIVIDDQDLGFVFVHGANPNGNAVISPAALTKIYKPRGVAACR